MKSTAWYGDVVENMLAWLTCFAFSGLESCRCQNGGVCPDPRFPTQCSCPTQYIGTLCETRTYQECHKIGLNAAAQWHYFNAFPNLGMLLLENDFFLLKIVGNRPSSVESGALLHPSLHHITIPAFELNKLLRSWWAAIIETPQRSCVPLMSSDWPLLHYHCVLIWVVFLMVPGVQPCQCQNGGSCRDPRFPTQCTCPPQYYGTLCESRKFQILAYSIQNMPRKLFCSFVHHSTKQYVWRRSYNVSIR